MTLRPDLAIIADHVAPGARVLDVGCGDGALMAALRDAQAGRCARAGDRCRQCRRGGRARAVGGAGRCRPDLADYPDDASTMRSSARRCRPRARPTRCSTSCCGSGGSAFVCFPNFAHWRVRLSLLWGGRMPVTRQLPVSWYETPNIHHVTIDDFRAFLAERGIIGRGRVVPVAATGRRARAAANFRAEHAVFLLSRA